MNHLCQRHDSTLLTALDLRGLLDPEALDGARQAIREHASNFSGRAAARLLADEVCAICFVNRALREDARNPGVTVDGWVENAADEALEASVDGKQDVGVIVHVT